MLRTKRTTLSFALVISTNTNMLRATTRPARLLSSATAIFLLAVSFLPTPSSAATETFIFAACSHLKYTPNSPYESNLNSLLTAIVNSAGYATYTNFTADTVYGLFQCRGDLPGGDCARCVALAASQLGTICLDSCSGALQLDGCLVKYDNATFIGVEDKTVQVKKCGPSVGYGSDALTGRDEMLENLAVSGGPYSPFRAGGSGNVHGVAQCVGDLSPSECQDCLSDAIGRLKTECASAAWGDMFLAKCYARYSQGGTHSHAGNGSSDEGNNDDETEKTLAILIGLIAGVTVLIVFLSFLRKSCDKGGKGGK